MISAIIHVLSGVLVIGTALSIWRYDAWWVRAWDFPRAQIVFLGVVLLVAQLVLRGERSTIGKVVMGLLVLSLALQFWRIYPYTSLAPKQSLDSTISDTSNQVSLMVANVLMENRNARALLDLIDHKQPDLFVAAEADQWWSEALRPLEDTYPHRLEKPLDNTYGLLLYSRFALIDTSVEFLLHDDVPSFHGRLQLESGREVRFHFLHPKPPYPSESLKTTTRDAEILTVGRQVGGDDVPSIMAGDLNDVAWSHTTRLFQRLSGMLDPRIGRGLYSTFHARIPIFRWPLDHVFHTEHFKVVALERLPPIGSDHFPIFVALSLESGAPKAQDAPDPEPGDRSEAAEKIEDGEEAAAEEDGDSGDGAQ